MWTTNSKGNMENTLLKLTKTAYLQMEQTRFVIIDLLRVIIWASCFEKKIFINTQCKL